MRIVGGLVLAAAGLSAVVQAHRHGMRHQHHKRQDDTCGGACTTIVTTTWVPYTPDPATSTSTVTVQTTQMVFVDQSDTTTVTYTATDGPAPTGGSKVKRVEPVENKDLVKRQYSGMYGITYTGYDPATGGCMDAAAILTDLEEIQALGFPRIRMYSVDCNQLTNVADQAIGLGLKVTLGVYIDNTGTARGYSDLDAILAWGQWGGVDVITIGNEAVFNNFISAPDMVAFIEECTTELRGAGYTGIISTAETVGTLQTYPELCSAVSEVIHCNIHPYYGNTPSANAGPFVIQQQQLAETICGLQVIVSETGWPSAGGSAGASVASVLDQGIAIASIFAATGGQVTWFSPYNDLWKAPGAEQNFGLISMF